MYDSTHNGIGATMVALTLEAIQANEGHDPRARDRGHRLHKQQDDQGPRGGYRLLYDVPGKSGGDDEGHDETTSRKTAGDTTVPTVPPQSAL
jgi:hypothetical protein